MEGGRPEQRDPYRFSRMFTCIVLRHRYRLSADRRQRPSCYPASFLPCSVPTIYACMMARALVTLTRLLSAAIPASAAEMSVWVVMPDETLLSAQAIGDAKSKSRIGAI